ncbi:unnamed protein product [Blepharisma stoltei]|uniref:Uncharacterized protein n=1 Tax=Blepharisma stoltei TaxID=1481888 RepID=A0AAU9JFD5_9CILI|nr:unnamed protein product [Blepharisma stoltei]
MIIISYVEKIVILNSGTLEKIQEIFMSQNRFGTFSMTNNKKFILFLDKEVLHFYDLSSFRDKETVNVDFQIIFIAQSIDNSLVFINGKKRQFYVLAFPVLEWEKSKIITSNEPLDRTKMVIKEDGYFKTWDFETDKTEKIIENKPGGWEVQNEREFFVYCYSDYTFSKVNIPTKTISTITLANYSKTMSH